MLQVAGLAGAVDDQEVVRAAVDEHQVVDDAALVIQQQAVALAIHAQADHVHRHQAFECQAGIGAGNADLAHVGYVEQAGGFARLLVFGQQAFVLHGHGVAGKRHHAGTQFQVQGIQGSQQQIAFRRGRGHGVSLSQKDRQPAGH